MAAERPRQAARSGQNASQASGAAPIGGMLAATSAPVAAAAANDRAPRRGGAVTAVC
jgi:hypothetical protein